MERVALCRGLPNEPARNQCIIDALRDPHTEQELRVLMAVYQIEGRTPEAIRLYREYLRRQGTFGPQWREGDFPVEPPPHPPERPGEAGRRRPPPRASI
jgi:DNA-binding SARP family transcriptional activator